MDNFSIPKTVLARVEVERPDGTRRTYNAEVMRKVIDDARHDGVSKSAKRHKIPYTTVKTWYDNWVSSKVYPMPGVRGRPPYFNEAAAKEAIGYVERLRDSGAQVTANTVGSVCRGVQERDCAALLSDNGGVRVFSKQHSRTLLRHSGYSPRCATTDRLMSASDLLRCGAKLYEELRAFSASHSILPRCSSRALQSSENASKLEYS